MKKTSILRLVHNVIVAAFIGLMISILEHHSMLNWLDSFSLRMSLAIKQETESWLATPNYDDSQINKKIDTVAVLVDNEAFESVFNQKSPLNKSILADLVGKLGQRSPRLIAIDVDLSPAKDLPDELIAQNKIDNLLIELSKNEVDIVLVNPLPIEDEKLKIIKYQWMKKLCQAGIYFGYPNINLSQGVALRYTPDYLSLGVLSSKVLKQTNALLLEDSPCALVAQGLQKAAFLDATFNEITSKQSFDFSKMLPVFPDVIKDISQNSYRWDGYADKDISLIPKDKVIFLGGGFDPRDNFLTIQGIQPGVIFHASVQATDALGVKKLSPILAFVFNFILGVLAGYLFNWAWSKQNQSMLSRANEEGSIWIKYIRARGWLLVNVLLLFSWVLILFSLTATLLKIQLWANPIAMIIGVFIKTMTSSRKGLDKPVESAFFSKSTNWSKLDSVTLLGDFILTAPVIIYGAYLTFFK